MDVLEHQEDGAFLADVAVDWSSSAAAVCVAPASGTSTRISGEALGTAMITASHAEHGTDDAGPITVAACASHADCSDPCYSSGRLECVSGTCEPVAAADKDSDGDGHVDAACPGGDDCDDDPGSCGASCSPSATELCDGRDNDCDPGTGDGADDSMVGAACDGPDSDLCEDDAYACTGGALVCSTGSDELDVCDGVDNDCDPATSDGADDSMVGTACDGPDSDLCEDDAYACMGGALVCSTGTDEPEVCDGVDNDCDPTTSDGADDSMVGTSCDGPDSDLCEDDAYECTGGALVCSTGSDDVEACNGADDDCDGFVDETFTCSPGETDSCTTGCGTTGSLSCDETCSWGSCVPPAETCNGTDDDCDGTCDDGFTCCAGSTRTCTTGCGSTGTQTCSGSCARRELHERGRRRL